MATSLASLGTRVSSPGDSGRHRLRLWPNNPLEQSAKKGHFGLIESIRDDANGPRQGDLAAHPGKKLCDLSSRHASAR
jgi:hypothetical protein